MREFVFELRVPYAHVDQMGVVYYAHYFVYFEMARAAFLREAGLPYPEMERGGVLLPVVEAHCEYHKPARFDDLLTVRSRCVALKGPRLRIEYTVECAGTPLAVGHTVHVCLSPDGRVLKPTPGLVALVKGPAGKT
jgi:acyl-CoA thioester hydrolase